MPCSNKGFALRTTEKRGGMARCSRSLGFAGGVASRINATNKNWLIFNQKSLSRIVSFPLWFLLWLGFCAWATTCIRKDCVYCECKDGFFTFLWSGLTAEQGIGDKDLRGLKTDATWWWQQQEASAAHKRSETKHLISVNEIIYVVVICYEFT